MKAVLSSVMLSRPSNTDNFPYTTLFRSTLSLAPSSYAVEQLTTRGVHRVAVWPHGVDRCRFDPQHRDERSEEHTSELQSRGHLVCRLLLEKIDVHALYDYNNGHHYVHED